MSQKPSKKMTKVEIDIQNHQQVVDFDDVVLDWLGRIAAQAWLQVEAVAVSAAPFDSGLEAFANEPVELDVALVDDAASAQVHQAFMGVDGPTDVITFEHGVLVIGVEVAQRQAHEHGEPLLREVLRYVVHGFLHLRGYHDDNDERRELMFGHQEAIVKALWQQDPM